MSFSINNLSFACAKQALTEGLAALQQGQDEFDLSQVSLADSSSIAVMLAWQRAAKKASRTLRFINTPSNILSLAALYGVSELLGLN